MKPYKIKLAAICSITLFAVSLQGCLKDDEYENGLIQSIHTNGTTPKVVEIKLTAGDVSNFFVVSYNNSTIDTTVELVPVNLATVDAATQDIHVTLVSAPQLVDDYNAANGSDYTDPSALFSLVDGGVVTIPAGSHTGYLKLKFKPSDFLGGNWAAGFKITSIAESGYTVSGNINSGIVAIVIKNEYDGNYNTSGVRTRFTGPTEASGVLDMFTISGIFNFATLNATTITGQLGDDGSGGTMALSVNGDGTVTVTNPPGGAYADLANTTGKISTYDAATKTFHIYASYHNASGNLREVDEVLVKTP